jgi:hypothetical protein
MKIRVDLRSTDLASPPSAAELEAIITAVQQALGAVAPAPSEALGPEQTAWRLGGRWWAEAPGSHLRGA